MLLSLPDAYSIRTVAMPFISGFPSFCAGCSTMAGSYRSSNVGSVRSRSQALDCRAQLRLAGRNRRLSKDYEYSVQTSETLIDIAATRLILNRLASA